MSDRKDLPPPNAPNFGMRLRETIQTYLGKQGDPLDRGLTLRDLIDAGVVKFKAGFSAASAIGGGSLAIDPVSTGSGTAVEVEPDLTPPPQPDGFAVTAAISHVFIEHNAPAYTQGHGHLRTRVYGVIVEAGDPLPTFVDAVEVGQFSGRVWAMPSNPAITWRLWIKWETNDGVLSPTPAGGTNGLEAVTGQDVSSLLNALSGEITESQLHQDLGSRIDLIDGAGIGSVNQRIAAEAVERAIEIQELASTAAQDLLNEVTARTTGDAALQTQINTLSAASSGDFQDLIAALQDEQTARIDGDAAEASSRQTLAAQMRGSYTGTDVTDVTTGLMFSERQARASGDSALATQINSLSSTVQTNQSNTQAAITSEASTRASADAALSSQITTLNSTLTTTTAAAAAAQTTATNAAAVATAAQTSANTANTSLADIASDSKLTPVEKQSVRGEWNVISAEKAGINTQASTFSVTTENTAYNNAFQSLATYLNAGAAWTTGIPSWLSDANLSVTTNITGSTFRANWAALYAARTALLNRIALKSKELADAAQTTANNKADASALTTTNTNVSNLSNTVTAQAGQITTLTSSVNSNATAISTEATTRASQTGDLFAKYTVKVDTNGYVSGFGFASTANNGATVSDFAIRADKFYIASPSGPGVAPSMPFIVRTTATTIGGVSVPVGVYMNDAFIQNGTITNAKIANLAVDNAKISSLAVDKLTAGSLAVGQYIQSSNYVAGTSGFRLDANGTAYLQDAVLRGTVYASAGQIGGNTIGSTYIRSNNYVLGQSGWNLNSDGTGQVGGISFLSNAMQSSNYVAGSAGWKLSRDGTFEASNGTFRGALSGATGTFSGALQAATGTFSGELSGASGTFSGSITAQVVNTENIVGGAVTSGYAVSTSNLSASVTVTVPSGASSVVIIAFIGFPITTNVGSTKDPNYTTRIPTGTLSIDGAVATAQSGTLVWTIGSIAAGSHAFSITRSEVSGPMNFSVLVNKR